MLVNNTHFGNNQCDFVEKHFICDPINLILVET